MIKKILMLLLVVGFLLGIVSIFYLYRSNIPPTSISLPLPKNSPTPTPGIALPTPTLTPTLIGLENDLKMIEADLQKIKADQRLDPPDFIFDLGVGE